MWGMSLSFLASRPPSSPLERHAAVLILQGWPFHHSHQSPLPSLALNSLYVSPDCLLPLLSCCLSSLFLPLSLSHCSFFPTATHPPATPAPPLPRSLAPSLPRSLASPLPRSLLYHPAYLPLPLTNNPLTPPKNAGLSSHASSLPSASSSCIQCLAMGASSPAEANTISRISACEWTSRGEEAMWEALSLSLEMYCGENEVHPHLAYVLRSIPQDQALMVGFLV